MRIALVSDCYAPRLGGIEVQVGDLARRLHLAGNEVEVFTATAATETHLGDVTEHADGVTVHRLAFPGLHRLPLDPAARPKLRRRLAEGRFDVVHLHMGLISPFVFDGAAACLELGLPAAMTWHCMLTWWERVFAASGMVRRWADGGIAMSAVSDVAAEPVRRLVAPEPVHVLHNGLDLDRWWAPPLPDRPADDPLTIVSALRMTHRKRAVPLVSVLDRARELAPDVPLRAVLAGDGPRLGAVRTAVRRAGAQDWIEAPGRLGRDELRDLLCRADVYVAPTRLETFGIAALEARCVGLPVVALAGSGAGEFVTDGVSGLLARDDEGLAAGLARLATDGELREGIREHNRAVRPVGVGWGDVVAATLAEYDRAAAALARRRPAASDRPRRAL